MPVPAPTIRATYAPRPGDRHLGMIPLIGARIEWMLTDHAWFGEPSGFACVPIVGGDGAEVWCHQPPTMSGFQVRPSNLLHAERVNS